MPILFCLYKDIIFSCSDSRSKGETATGADSFQLCYLYLTGPHKSIMSSEVIDISEQNASQSLCFRHVLPKRSNQLLGIEFSNLQMANLCSKCFQHFSSANERRL